MEVLLAVMKELWTFTVTELFGAAKRVTQPKTLLPRTGQILQIAMPQAATFLPAQTPSSPIPLPSQQTALSAASLRIVIPTACVRKEPVVAFDNVMSTLSYGTSVHVDKRSGRFVQISSGAVSGWIETDALKTQTEVLPQFQLGKLYDAYNPETIKLRLCINDGFGGLLCDSLLTGVEYVTYRLWQQSRVLPWQATYGRVPGTWQRKLRGVRGVRIDIMPHTGSIMEYILDDVGYVAYVDTVSPDLRIKVTGISLTNEGQFTEQVLDHAIWREFHPVFIVLT
jgi:hypothetical protein